MNGSQCNITTVCVFVSKVIFPVQLLDPCRSVVCMLQAMSNKMKIQFLTYTLGKVGHLMEKKTLIRVSHSEVGLQVYIFSPNK